MLPVALPHAAAPSRLCNYLTRELVSNLRSLVLLQAHLYHCLCVPLLAIVAGA